MEFKVWLEEQEAWKAKKTDVLRFWHMLRELPIFPNPIPVTHKGSSYNQDTIRITGNSDFINSILSKMKDFLRYQNNPTIELNVDYRQILDKYDRPVPAKYACYIKLKEKKKDYADKKLDFKPPKLKF
jgi:hypothetical protein